MSYCVVKIHSILTVHKNIKCIQRDQLGRYCSSLKRDESILDYSGSQESEQWLILRKKDNAQFDNRSGIDKENKR